MFKILLQIQTDNPGFWTVSNWYYLFAAVTALLSITIGYKNFKKKSPEVKPSDNFSHNTFNNSSNFSNSTSVPVHVTNNINTVEHRISENSGIPNEENLKATTKILFIDDNYKEYKIVSILKKAGWTKTNSVKDVNDLDAPVIKESDIIFVDINGVGLELFQDQGLGLASALKKKYPKKKIVIYSAETTGDRFHQALREVDHCLPKNADAFQFINLIENSLRQ
jgi:hypothetical protein